MDDRTNSIAWLSPAITEGDGTASRHTWDTIRMNISGDFTPHKERRSGSYSRESTAPPEDNDLDHNSFPKFYLNFNPGPKGSRGFEIGTNPSCDIVLPKLERISRVHCAITFDDQRRLILRDLSSNGTIVEYDTKGGELRRSFVTLNADGQKRHHHFKWILGGDDFPRETKNIVIDIQGMRFRIKVFNHDEIIDQYNLNVDRFLQQVQENDELPLGKFKIQSLPSTVAPSGAQTPGHDPIRLKRDTLGRGSFAVVRRCWDVSTGLEYAYKEPVNKENVIPNLWEKEALILGQISHNHLVKLVDLIYKPWPCLILEYMPLGTLLERHPGLRLNIARAQVLTILEQSLSALAYVHGRNPPITHRDIKPENILVQSLQPLCIKLADFGLARVKTGTSFGTIGGTATYAAPEISGYFESSRQVPIAKYTPAIDIWSLGVVILWCSYGLPDPGQGGGIDWCNDVMTWAQVIHPSDDIIDLLTSAMLVTASNRESADVCLSRVLEFSIICWENNTTSRPESNLNEIQGARDYSSTQKLRSKIPPESDSKDIPGSKISSSTKLWSQSTPATSSKISLQQGKLANSNPSAVIRRDVSPEDLSSDSSASVSAGNRKRSIQLSTSSLSSSRSTKRHVIGTTALSSYRQHAEPEPEFTLFHENWLLDPNCVGSSVAAMGEESEDDLSDWSSFGTTPATQYPEPDLPQSRLEPVDENDDDLLIQDGNRGWTASEARLAEALLALPPYDS